MRHSGLYCRAAAALAVSAPLAALPMTAHAAEGGLKLLSFSTLFGQFLTVSILVWVMMKFVWPPVMRAIEARQKEIADGLAAADEGRQSLENAKSDRQVLLNEARAKTTALVEEGEKRKAAIIDSAQGEAEAERARIVEQGRREVEAERLAMQRDMQQRLGGLVMAGATKVLRREVDAKAHQDIVDSLKEAL